MPNRVPLVPLQRNLSIPLFSGMVRCLQRNAFRCSAVAETCPFCGTRSAFRCSGTAERGPLQAADHCCQGRDRCQKLIVLKFRGASGPPRSQFLSGAPVVPRACSSWCGDVTAPPRSHCCQGRDRCQKPIVLNFRGASGPPRSQFLSGASVVPWACSSWCGDVTAPPRSQFRCQGASASPSVQFVGTSVSPGAASSASGAPVAPAQCCMGGAI